MSTVSTLIEQCLRQAGLVDVAASDCQLIFNKRPLDKTTPFRHLNVPALAKLELITGTEPHLGLHSNSGSQAASTQSAVTPAASRISEIPSALERRPELVAPRPNQADAGMTTLADTPRAAASGAAGLLQPQSSTAPTSAPAAGRQVSDPAARLDLLGLGRPVLVFSRQAVEHAEQGAGPGPADPPDEFFEFTADDFHRVAAAAGRTAQRREAGLRTAKLRADELRARAAKFGPDLVAACVQPAYRSAALFTAPPKQVISDFSVSFYEAGLVPAAHVHLSQPQPPPTTDAAVLRPEVAALQRDPPKRAAKEPDDVANRELATIDKLAAAAAQGSNGAAAAPKTTAAGSKVPKWMKVGK